MMIEAHAKALMDALEGGATTKDQRKRIIGAACFVAMAYERSLALEAAPVAFALAFLKAIVDPLDPELDFLRADPASGAAARENRKGGAQ